MEDSYSGVPEEEKELFFESRLHQGLVAVDTCEEAPGGGRRQCRRGISAILTFASFAVAAFVAFLYRMNTPTQVDARKRFREDHLQVKSLLPDFPSQCGKMEENVEYTVEGGWYMSLDHIPEPEMCCAMCQGVPQCKAFTWVKDAGLDGCPSQCWLKGGLPTAKPKKQGLVSGLPPPRAPFPSPAALAARHGQHEQLAEADGRLPTLFCYSLLVPHSYEEGLIRFQHEEKVSIFSCDAWDVYSNISLSLCPGVKTTVVHTDLTVKFGGDSYTALNTWIFIAVWKRVIDDRQHKKYDWLVKVDPDAVFFPHRLRPTLTKYAGVGYINNCKYGLHGPIEVLSAKAFDVLEADYKASFDGKAPKKCVTELNFGLWGEDFFLTRCLWQVHGVSRVTNSDLMCEAHCDCKDFYWCNGDAVTYHPFKRADMYKQCMANSVAAGARGL